MIIASVILAFVLGLLLRSYLLLRYQWAGVDSFYHLAVAEEIRKGRHIPRIIDRYIFPEEFDYPPLLSAFLSRFGRRYHQRLQFLGPLSDILTAALIFGVVHLEFGATPALIALALYLFAPFAVGESSNLSPRPLANLFLAAGMVSLFYSIPQTNVIAFVLAVVFFALVLLSHRQTTQSLACALLVLALVMRTPTPVYALLASIALALILSKGFYWKVFRGHLAFIWAWGKTPLAREAFMGLLDLRLLLFNVPTVAMLPVIIWNYGELERFFSLWLLALVALSVIWILGQGHRHVYNAIAPLSVVIALWLTTEELSYLAAPIILVSLGLSLYKMRRIANMPELGGFSTQDLVKAFGYVKEHQQAGDVLLCLPLTLSYQALYFTDCTVLESSGGWARGLMILAPPLHKKIKIDEGGINEVVTEYDARWIIQTGGDQKLDYPVAFSSGEVRVLQRNSGPEQ